MNPLPHPYLPALAFAKASYCTCVPPLLCSGRHGLFHSDRNAFLLMAHLDQPFQLAGAWSGSEVTGLAAWLVKLELSNKSAATQLAY